MTVSFFFVRQHILRGLLLVALAWPVPGRADDAPVPSASANGAAQSRFEAGVAAYEEGRYRDAVERFKEADQLAPSPLLSFNVAKVYERMGDNRSALGSYREYLRRLPSAENRQMVVQRIAELERALRATGVQQLTVLSTPPGATVLIDNVSRGVTPWTGELIPGPHTLTLRRTGYREVVSEIELPVEHATDVELPLVEEETPEAVAITPETPAAAAPQPVSSAKAGRVAAPLISLPTQPAEEIGIVPRWWTWALFGGSAAALAGAGAFELMRGNLEDEARQSQVQIEHEQKFGAMQDRQTAARVFLGVGVVAAIAGGVSLYFDLRDANTPPSDVAFGCGSTGCTLEAKGRF